MSHSLNTHMSIYSGKCLSRKELALKYGISHAQFNRWLKELETDLQLNSRSNLRPREIAKIITTWGDFREETA